MISSTAATSTTAKPEQSPVSDDVARAVVQALLDSDLLGVALLRAGDWVHLMANAAYDALMSAGEPTTGRPFSDVVIPEAVSDTRLEAVVSTGHAARVPRVALVTSDGETTASPRYVTFTLLPVRSLTPAGDAILVFARDVSSELHDERMAELFLLLARDMSTDVDEASAIRAAVAHAKEALGASAASLFLLGPDGKSLHGALVGWDWTRSSFVTDLEQWPNVARAIAANEACHFTAAHAERAEEGWFESRGIDAAICAPMAVDGHLVGALFFDYAGPPPYAVDLALAKTVADQCALLVEREAARLERGR
ncbi:MAG: hypothetical protein BGO98_13455 [Myxococcales bacterium 68-20]|nr:MAG: hypothetical protein BGO98_13455 [Myxococcales bacterium 68-20]